LRSANSGLFWFFDLNNWEMLIKVLDGCAINGHYWVLGAATTDVGYQLEIRDTTGNAIKRCTHPCFCLCGFGLTLRLPRGAQESRDHAVGAAHLRRLGVELDAKSTRNLQNRGETGIPIGAQGSIEILATEAGVFGNLAHASGASNISKGLCDAPCILRSFLEPGV
jgi:hypothetical protein